MDFIRTEDLPEDAKVSIDMKQRAKFFGVIMLSGVNYYIPVTKEMKKLFNIRIRNGKLYHVNHGFDSTDFVRDLIASVYFQTRDVVGDEIYSNLSSEITGEFRKFFSNGLSRVINKQLENKTGQLLEDKSENKVLYEGFVKVLKHRNTGYEIVKVTDSVAFLIWDSSTDSILLTLQHRVPMGCALLEVPAGRFDVDLDVKELVVKEAKEEVGVTITEDDVFLLNNGKPLAVAPGVLTERCYLAYVEVSASQIEKGDTYGVPEEGESIQRVSMSVEDLMMDTVVYDDMKTSALVHYFLRERMRKNL